MDGNNMDVNMLIAWIADLIPNSVGLREIYTTSRFWEGDYIVSESFGEEYQEISERSIFNYYKKPKIKEYHHQEKKEQLEKIIQYTEQAFSLLGIVHTIGDEITRIEESYDKKIYFHRGKYSFRIPEEQKEYVWNILSESYLLILKRASNGWAERMQNSELANRLAEAVCIFYEKKCDAEKKLSFGVTVYDDKVHAEFERHTTHIIGWDLEFKKYGYQNLKTEEQLYGLSWLITEYMLDKLSTLGALYTLFSYKGGYPSVRVGFGPVFQVYEKPKELKEW